MDTDGLEQVTDGLENWCSPQKKSPKKPINRMCLGEESTDEPSHSQATAPSTPHSQATAPQAKDRGGLQGSPRWGLRQLTEAECQCPVHLVRL